MKITQEGLKKVEAKKFAYKIIEVELEGENFQVKVDNSFRDSKVEVFVQNVSNDVEECEKKEIQIHPIVLSNLNLVKVFTDIEFPEETEGKIDMFYLLTDLGITEQVFEAFDEKQIQKLNEKIIQIQENLPKIIEELKKQNPELEGGKIDAFFNTAITKNQQEN